MEIGAFGGTVMFGFDHFCKISRRRRSAGAPEFLAKFGAVSDPDDKILFDALREAGATENLAYTAVQEVRNMAGQNIIAAIDALNGKIDAQGTKIDGKIDAQGTKIDSKIDAQGTEIRATRWMLGAILALLATLAALGLFNTVLGLIR